MIEKLALNMRESTELCQCHRLTVLEPHVTTDTDSIRFGRCRKTPSVYSHYETADEILLDGSFNEYNRKSWHCFFNFWTNTEFSLTCMTDLDWRMIEMFEKKTRPKCRDMTVCVFKLAGCLALLPVCLIWPVDHWYRDWLTSGRDRGPVSGRHVTGSVVTSVKAFTDLLFL